MRLCPTKYALASRTAMDKIVTDGEADPEFVRKARRLGIEVV